MPVKNFPFLPLAPDYQPRPWLEITIFNPHKPGKKISTYGLIDTGADACTVPAYMAKELGHNLKKGTRKDFESAGGSAVAYEHTTSIRIQDNRKKGENIVYSIPDTPIDFAVGLDCVLLGVNMFLDNFILNINYPKKEFSITFPSKKK